MKTNENTNKNENRKPKITEMRICLIIKIQKQLKVEESSQIKRD